MKVTKKLQKFIDSIATVGKLDGSDIDEDCYLSKVNGSYLTFVGLENDLKFLLKRGVTEQVQSGLGFNPTEQKWYGWSHRAIFGYGIGSITKKSSVAYNPENKEMFLEHLKSMDENINPSHKCTYKIVPNGVEITSEFLGYPDDKSQDKFIGDINTQVYEYPEKWGKGEWTASTLLDAKMMAMDFSQSVS